MAATLVSNEHGCSTGRTCPSSSSASVLHCPPSRRHIPGPAIKSARLVCRCVPPRPPGTARAGGVRASCLLLLLLAGSRPSADADGFGIVVYSAWAGLYNLPDAQVTEGRGLVCRRAAGTAVPGRPAWAAQQPRQQQRQQHGTPLHAQPPSVLAGLTVAPQVPQASQVRPCRGTRRVPRAMRRVGVLREHVPAGGTALTAPAAAAAAPARPLVLPGSGTSNGGAAAGGWVVWTSSWAYAAAAATAGRSEPAAGVPGAACMQPRGGGCGNGSQQLQPIIHWV